MRVYRQAKSCRCVVLFGSGTVGEAMAVKLERAGYEFGFEHRNQWRDSESLYRCVSDLRVSEQLAGAQQIYFVYAAGRAGFSVEEVDAAAELSTWSDLLRGIVALRSALRASAQVRVFLMSSAGGLFEGQTGVDVSTTPAPVRAYGRLKLSQEALLRENTALSGSQIFRLSSVYGKPHPRARASLISNLLENSFLHRVTSVTGALDTLRDYVHAEEVASFVVGRIGIEGAEQTQCFTLASGRPISILEVLRVVERATRRKPLIRFADRANSAPISFLPSAVPASFKPSNLETNVGMMLRSPAFKSIQALS